MINEAISSILQQEAEAVRNIPITDGYEEAVTLIVKHVHELGGNLITSGMGKRDSTMSLWRNCLPHMESKRK